MTDDRIWRERFAMLHGDGAIEAVARCIARPIMEEFDGLEYGRTIDWAKLPEREKIPIRFIAQRAVRAMVSHAHVAASGTPTQRAETTGSVGEADGGPTAESRDAQTSSEKPREAGVAKNAPASNQ